MASKQILGKLLYRGIKAIHSIDAIFADEKGYKIKLIARACKLKDERIPAHVLQQFINENSQLYNVKMNTTE